MYKDCNVIKKLEIQPSYISRLYPPCLYLFVFRRGGFITIAGISATKCHILLEANAQQKRKRKERKIRVHHFKAGVDIPASKSIISPVGNVSDGVAAA